MNFELIFFSADETPAVSAKNGKAKGGGKNGKTGKGQPSLEKRMAAFSKLVRPNSIEAPGSSFEKQLAAAGRSSGARDRDGLRVSGEGK